MSRPAVAGIAGRDRFQEVWRRCLQSGATDNSAEIYRSLLDGYNEANRHYHSLAHIEHCLRMFEKCKPLVTNADALELAIWFHDAIIEPCNHNDEARSAEFYRHFAERVHDIEICDLVERLIMATLHDGGSMQDADAIYMVDIDLSSFGLPWPEFLQDSENLRLENTQICDEEYRHKQDYFRNCLLARDRFFQSDFFASRYETRARENLARYFRQIDNGA